MEGCFSVNQFIDKTHKIPTEKTEALKHFQFNILPVNAKHKLLIKMETIIQVRTEGKIPMRGHR